MCNFNSSQFAKALVLPVMLLIALAGIAQCPDNIGVEQGMFTNWNFFEGFYPNFDVLSTTTTKRISIIKKSYPQQLDSYGNFPVNTLDGSNYSIKIGSGAAGGYADRAVYTFKIPDNKNSYSITYNYAVVIANSAGPFFDIKVHNTNAVVDTAPYIQDTIIPCYSLHCDAGMHGFQKYPKNEWYSFKPWSSATINLDGYAGKIISLEFTAHDCPYDTWSDFPHFAYAYFDIKENCGQPITGNIYCKGATSVTLTAPVEMQSYQWFNNDYSQLLSTSNPYQITPAPPAGTVFHVITTPYKYMGCVDTFSTTMESRPDEFKFKIPDSIVGACPPAKVSLIDSAVTAGSSPGLVFTYFNSLSQATYLYTPDSVPKSGLYYIKAENNVGCTDIKPIKVIVKTIPGLVIQDIVNACFPGKADLTDSSVTLGSEPGLSLTYWKDSLATVSLTNPKSIDSSGIYYIKAINPAGCVIVKSAKVFLSTYPIVTVADQKACGVANLVTRGVVNANQSDTTLTYWEDKNAIVQLDRPDSILFSNTYFIKVTNSSGCSTITPVPTTVYPIPGFSVVQPPPVSAPMYIDLTVLPKPVNNAVYTYSYWKDTAATMVVTQPSNVTVSGRYYIKATSTDGCTAIDSAWVIVNAVGVKFNCPDNIGFETGTFQNWNLFFGRVVAKDGSLTLQPSVVTNSFKMLQNNYPPVLDHWGNFPITCPNGTNYSIMLGSGSSGGNAQRVSYTFTIPANLDNYSLVLNYAVVLQNPSDHKDWEQPGFTSNIFDVTANQYIECGAFNFVASSNLPGFKLSPLGQDVYYKTWSPVTIKLVGYGGKTIRIEFTSHDCARAGHFGYAYLDVNENCTSPVSGNVYCAGAGSVNLTAPYGFSGYQWYNEDYSKLLGSTSILKISPPPLPNTIFHVIVYPYPGLGCLDTMNTSLQSLPNVFTMKVKDSVVGCPLDKIDITAASITAGSTPGIKYSYYTDLTQTDYIPAPQKITHSGIYYIKGINDVGCNDIQPIKVVFLDTPKLVVKNQLPVCYPDKADITAAAVTTGSEAGLIFSYWKDLSAYIRIPLPKAIDTKGTYYIKAVNAAGCLVIKPVIVAIASLPEIATKDQSNCPYVDLTAIWVATVLPSTAILSYWEDAIASKKATSPGTITVSGIYYIKATDTVGCSAIAPVQVTVMPTPAIIVTQPAPAILPVTINLTMLVNPVTPASYIYSYWLDRAATISVIKPTMIAVSGTYYIKASTSAGCSIIDSVNVVVKEPSIIPPNAFSPNKDGINDTWEIPLINFYSQCSVEIFSRSGQRVFHSVGYNKPWDGTINGKPLPMATYYYIIKIDAKHAAISGSITIIQ